MRSMTETMTVKTESVDESQIKKNNHNRNGKGVKELAYEYLYNNGRSNIQDITNYVMLFKPTTTSNSVGVCLHYNKKTLFKNVGVGMWDLFNDTLDERKGKLMYKLVSLMQYYEKLLSDNKIKFNELLAGISFNAEDEKWIKENYDKYKKTLEDVKNGRHK